MELEEFQQIENKKSDNWKLFYINKKSVKKLKMKN